MIKFLTGSIAEKYKNKTCLLRIDLNVEPGGPLYNHRLEAVLPTLKLLLKHRIKVVILSHRGRPDGNKKVFSLAPFAPIIAKKLRTPVDFIYTARLGALQKASALSTARIVLVENLRFFRGEETNDPTFARELAKLGDFYVNDAFAVSHRKNASVCAITKYLPSYAGLLMEKEIRNLDGAMKKYKHPFTIIAGGVKISDKLGVLTYFQNKADYFLLTGGPANTFFLALDMPVGDSFVEKGELPFVRRNLDNERIVLPSDVKAHGKKILDVGERTIKQFMEIIKKSRTIIWNGPPGLYEKKGFEKGTVAIWKAILANKKSHTVIGGGETIASLSLLKTKSYKLKANIFLSTGGGAMLEYLSGKELPGIKALK